MQGWIKLHKSIIENPYLMKDKDALAIWIWLLCNATYEKIDTMFNGQRVTLKRGQLICGRKQISEQLHINESKVFRTTNKLESEHMIEQQKSSHGTLITIVNWNKYQWNEQPTEQQVNSQPNNNRTSSEHQVNTIQERKEYKERVTSIRYRGLSEDVQLLPVDNFSSDVILVNDTAKDKLSAMRERIKRGKENLG